MKLENLQFKALLLSVLLTLCALSEPAYAVLRGRTASSASTSTAAGSGLPAFGVITAATAGDSIMALGFSGQGGAGGGPSYSFTNINQINQLRSIWGGRIYMPMTNNFAVAGAYCTTPSQIPQYYTNAINSGAQLIFGDACRNDLSGGSSYATLQPLITTILSNVSNSNSRLMFLPLLPENAYTLSQRQIRIRLNRLVEEIGSGLRPDLLTLYNINPNNLPFIIDTNFMEDYTNGGRLAGWGTSDGTHLTGSGTYQLAKQDAAVLQSNIVPRPTFQNYYEDYYDATNNPTGNLLNNNSTVNDGLMNGTGGTVLNFTGITPTGQVANRFQALRNQGTSTATYVLSKETTRADGISGTGQVAQIDCSSGSNFEQYRLQYTGTIPTPIVGNTVYATATYQVLDQPTGFLGASIYVTESGNATNQSTQDGSPNQDTANFGINSPSGDMFLRTPPITLQASTTSLSMYAFIFMDCRTSGHVKLAWRDLGLRYQ